MTSAVPSFPEQASARYDGPLPADLIPHLAAHLREAEVEAEETASGIAVALPRVRLRLERDAAGLAASIAADDTIALHHFREYLLHLLDQIAPGVAQAMAWTGAILRDTAPPNFHLATVRSSRRVAPRFLRIELDCPGAAALARGKGMHFSLLLPPEGRAPVWPRLDGDGRTAWPRDADALHRAVYTFVTLEAEAGRFTFDVFEHEGGRVTGWAQSARPGDLVGITGPGSGDFPAGDAILLAGDETALPAIRRILERSSPDRRGAVFVEVADEADLCDLPRPEGMALTWVLRGRGETLWDHLQDLTPPPGPSRFVWVAAEKALVRKAKARFRDALGLSAGEGYFAYYWTATEAAPSR